MGWFDSFRDEGQNTYYSSHRIAVWADVKQVVVIIVCSVVVIALFIVVCGTRGKERLTTFLRAAFTLHTGVFIILVVHSQDWLVTHGNTRCPYMAQQEHDITAYVTISVGLSSLNITLRGESNDSTTGEIGYNEEFKFVTVHDMHHELLRAKEYGLPDTIIYIVEYFSTDHGQLRWCRHLRAAGRYTRILLWTTFAMWCVYNIVLCFVVFYGAALMTLTGLIMLCACAVFHFLQPSTPLTIPFDDTYAEFQYGWCLYVALISGSITLLTGLLLMLLSHTSPIGVAKVFLLDLSDFEEDPDLTADNPATQADTTSRCNFRTSRCGSMAQEYVNRGFQGDNEGKPRGSCTYKKRGGGAASNGAKNRLECSIVECPQESETEEYTLLPAITINQNNQSAEEDIQKEVGARRASERTPEQQQVPNVIVH